MEVVIKSKVLELQFFPCIDYVKELITASHVKLEACESFQKMSFRNRCVVASNNGLVSLTVPLKNGREQKVGIKDVEVDYSQHWQRQHWRTLLSCYRKAPFFEFYSHQVEELLFSSPKKKLFDLDVSIISWLTSILKISTDITYTTGFQSFYSEGDILDMRNRWLPRNFQEEGMVRHQKYSQVFEDKIGFQPNLSILDLLFCEGPNAKNILLSNV